MLEFNLLNISTNIYRLLIVCHTFFSSFENIALTKQIPCAHKVYILMEDRETMSKHIHM